MKLVVILPWILVSTILGCQTAGGGRGDEPILPPSAEERLVSWNPAFECVTSVSELFYSSRRDCDIIGVKCGIRYRHGGRFYSSFVLHRTKDANDWHEAELYFVKTPGVSIDDFYGQNWEDISADVITVEEEVRQAFRRQEAERK